jgi:adenylate cyclase
MRRRTVRRLVEATTTTAVITALAAAGLGANAFAGFERRASDSLFPSARRDPQVVVVGIDSKSLAALGPLPWPRSVHAALARQFRAAGVKVGVWDVVFAGARDGDTELAEALAGLPATVVTESIQTKPSRVDDSLLDVTTSDPPTSTLVDGTGVTIGHAQVKPDPTDGVVRSLPVVVDQDGTLLPSLSLAAFRALRGDTGPVTIRPDGVQAGGRFIPTEGRHELRLNWAPGLDSNTDRRTVISAIDVINGTINPARLQDKVVFVGATEPTLGDNQLAPVDKSGGIPGVLIHANGLNTLLTASYLEAASDTTSLLWIALVAALVALAVLFLPVWLSTIAAFLIAVAYLVLAFVRFDAGQILNVVYVFAAIVLAFVAALALRYATETRQRRKVSALFAQYVPEEVARQLEESGRLDATLDGERLDTSLFFCDLRGFTSMSATLEAPDVRGMLNAFYELLTEIILARGGTVLKFVGDEVFAVFGAPLPVENHPQVALECAMEIQRRAPELDVELQHLGIPPMQFGIGMNSGEVVAAHVGGGKRRQYDIVGDTVNLASRLCGQAGKGEIVIPEAMRDRLSDAPEMQPMGPVQLKGLDEPVPLYKVIVDESVAVAR